MEEVDERRAELGNPDARGLGLPPVALYPLDTRNQDIQFATVGDLATVIAPFSADTRCGEIAEMLRSNPQVRTVTVLNDNLDPVLFTRARFLSSLAGPFGYALHDRRPVRSLLHSSTLVLSADTPVVEASQAILGREDEFRYDDMVIEYGDGTLGSLSVAKVLEQISDLRDHQALHDSLTNLANRNLLMDRLRRALRRLERNGDFVAILFLDLDRFKIVNDSLGHRIGDQLLVQVAARLSTVVRDTDTVCRLGGDEFVLLLDGISTVEEGTTIAERALRAFEDPFLIADRKTRVTPSIGISTVSSSNSTPEDVLRDADLAMYKAKKKGGNRYDLFDPALNRRAHRRHEIETRLRETLESDGFEVHYQPKMNLADGRLLGFEALMRWNDAELGHVPPSEFIEVAEQTGLIIPIGSLVIEKACTTMAALNMALLAERRDIHPARLSINLCARQFQHDGLLGQVRNALKISGLGAENLCFEITEGTYMSDVESAIIIMHQFRNAGIRFSVDDFGTGYSSLSYIRRFPVDELKIDKSFVDGLGRRSKDESLVRAMVALGHALDLEVIAEGVENEVQLGLLRAMGCDAGQGFLFAKALPAAEAQRFALTLVASPHREPSV